MQLLAPMHMVLSTQMISTISLLAPRFKLKSCAACDVRQYNMCIIAVASSTGPLKAYHVHTGLGMRM